MSLHNYNYVEETYQPMYDTALIPNLPERQEFFQRPIGTPGDELSPRGTEDTSFYRSGMLPENNQFYLTGVGVYFVPNITACPSTREMDIRDTLTVLGQGCLRLQIANRRYLEVAPLAVLTPNFPMYWGREDARLEKLWQGSGELSGDAVPQRVKRDEGFAIVPLLIESRQWFSVEITFKYRQKLFSTGKLGVILYGRLLRSAI
jgi:hypothetical protein